MQEYPMRMSTQPIMRVMTLRLPLVFPALFRVSEAWLWWGVGVCSAVFAAKAPIFGSASALLRMIVSASGVLCLGNAVFDCRCIAGCGLVQASLNPN